MCIYCPTTKYRKIYEQHFGAIPKDSDGRSYDIHHVDGNHSNNEPNNLKALTIQEHYDIHYSQRDWYACLKMAQRIKFSPEETSAIARKNALKLVENGKHPFLGGEESRKINTKRINEGTHNFLGPSLNDKRVNDGTHHFLGNKINQNRIKEGTHNFLGPNANLNRLSLGTHPSQIHKTCEYCNKTTSINNYTRYHGNKCITLTNIKHTTKPHKPRKLIQCEICSKIVDTSNFKKYNHGVECKQIPK